MMTIDAHQHFWQLSRDDYHWLTEAEGDIYRDFLPDDLRTLLDEARVTRTVLVQAAQTVEETEFLLALAKKNDFIAGVVGWVDFEQGQLAVDKLSELSKSPKFCGVRPMIHEIEDINWMLNPELEQAVESLDGFGLCFDALVRPEHLDNLSIFLRKYSELKVVIDHGAKPDIAGSNVGEWKKQIAAIASETGAYCKLSGLLTEAKSGAGYQDIEPYMEFLLENFGADRLMWGSDWPVLNSANNYLDWIAMARRFISSLSDHEQRQIMGETANQFYSLGE